MEFKSRIKLLSTSAVALLALVSNQAVAHPLHTAQGTFSEGFAHGIIAWEHWLAALLVGFLSRIVLAEFQSGQGKVLAIVTSFYTLSHLSAASMSGTTMTGLFVGFLFLSLLGAGLGQFTYIAAKSPRVRISLTTIALVGLMLSGLI